MIPVQCSCGAKYQAKDSKSGTTFICQKCGSELKVPNAAADSPAVESDADYGVATPSSDPPADEFTADEFAEGEFAEEEVAPKLPPPSKKKKQKKTVAEYTPPPSYEGLSLEERIAARRTAPEPTRSNWSAILTGDIRPLLVGGSSVLVGIGFIIFAFLLPGQEFSRDRSLEELASMTRNERTGTSVLGGIYNIFGQTGLTIFMVLFGIAIIGGGVWFMRNYEYESDD